MERYKILDKRYFLYGLTAMDSGEDYDYYSGNGHTYICTVNRICGKREGIAVMKDEHGKVIAELIYSNDSINGRCTRYFKKYKRVCFVTNDIMDGNFWEYNNNDSLIRWGQYIKGERSVLGETEFESSNQQQRSRSSYYSGESQPHGGIPRRSNRNELSQYRSDFSAGQVVTALGAVAVGIGASILALSHIFGSSHDDDQ